MQEKKQGVGQVGPVELEGQGEVKIDTKEKGEEIHLPPKPEDAVEFNPGKEKPQDILEAIADELNPAKEEEKVAGIEDAVESAPEEEQTIVQEAQTTMATEQPVEQPAAAPIDVKKVVEDPVPTEHVEPEFNPATSQNALDDFDKEGGVRRAVGDGAVPVFEDVKEGKMGGNGQIDIGHRESDFNPGTVQNALLDSEREGGVVSSKSASNLKSSMDGDAGKEGFQIKQGSSESEADNAKKYRVYGFTVQYESESKVVTKQVSDYFVDLDTAFVSVNNTKYLLPLPNGAFKVASIVSGLPMISFENKQTHIYKYGVWKKV